MRYVAFVAMSLLLFGAALCAQSAKQAKAELINAQGEKIGMAILTEEAKGVKIKLTASKLPPGVHGFHIHAVGKCDAPEFASAGAHFNPEGKKHGLQNPEGPHAGDLPNITVKQDGTVEVEVVAPSVTLGEGKNSLFHPDGTSLMVHADPDDGKSDPAGHAGARIACGVITR